MLNLLEDVAAHPGFSGWLAVAADLKDLGVIVRFPRHTQFSAPFGSAIEYAQASQSSILVDRGHGRGAAPDSIFFAHSHRVGPRKWWRSNQRFNPHLHLLFLIPKPQKNLAQIR
jgi:hypothetical protein